MTFTSIHSRNWDVIRNTLAREIMANTPTHTGEWQSQDVSDKPEMATREAMNVSFQIDVQDTGDHLAMVIEPNLPWAEDHFQERVSGKPLNPPPSEQWWPFAQQGNKEHKEGEIFSHTYPERLWPKFANEGNTRPNGRQVFVPHNGIRYEYGDLVDVVNLLRRAPFTRQAFVPLWFPEDTGNVSNVRVPCTLGYHFVIRKGALHITYYMRSCDFLRHFTDDIYMAARLLQQMYDWVAPHLNEQFTGGLGVGTLTAHIASLHIFEGDMPLMKMRYGAL